LNFRFNAKLALVNCDKNINVVYFEKFKGETLKIFEIYVVTSQLLN